MLTDKILYSSESDQALRICCPIDLRRTSIIEYTTLLGLGRPVLHEPLSWLI